MKGIELSKRFYEQYGAPMLENGFPELLPFIAVGLAGSGSECFGYDDEISRDHDFEPGFCIFLPDAQLVDDRAAFALERAYAKLPREFMGYKRNAVNPVGGSRHGVIRMADFFAEKCGNENGILTLNDWFFVPEQALAEATNGEVFCDNFGRFTEIRERLAYMPEDVRLKKLAGNLLLLGQSGQYNFMRCVKRGEFAAAQLSLNEFVKSALQVIFLLNKRYALYYKWSFHALREQGLLAHLYEPLERLLCGTEPDTTKAALIEQICGEIAAILHKQGITQYCGNEAEAHAYSVNEHITDNTLRNKHILYAV